MNYSVQPPPTGADFAKESPEMAANLVSLRKRISMRQVIGSGADIQSPDAPGAAVVVPPAPATPVAPVAAVAAPVHKVSPPLIKPWRAPPAPPVPTAAQQKEADEQATKLQVKQMLQFLRSEGLTK